MLLLEIYNLNVDEVILEYRRKLKVMRPKIAHLIDGGVGLV